MYLLIWFFQYMNDWISILISSLVIILITISSPDFFIHFDIQLNRFKSHEVLKSRIQHFQTGYSKWRIKGWITHEKNIRIQLRQLSQSCSCSNTDHVPHIMNKSYIHLAPPIRLINSGILRTLVPLNNVCAISTFNSEKHQIVVREIRILFTVTISRFGVLKSISSLGNETRIDVK